jgi:hypothetical protein
MKKVTIDEDQLKHLEESHNMLLQIKSRVLSFCKENDTTLMGVLRLLVAYHDLKTNNLLKEIYFIENNQNQYFKEK